MQNPENHTLHYRPMFSENRAVILLINPDNGGIVDASIGACQYYGYSLSDLTAMSIFDINTMSNNEISVEMQRAKEESKNHFNFRHRLASGEVRDVEVYSNPIPMEGQKFLYSIIHDVTDRKEAEEQYRNLFERTGTGMAVIEADGALSLVNHTFAQLAEVDELELIGHSFLEGVADADKARMQEYHLKRLNGEDAPENYEFQFKTLKGSKGWALMNLTFFPDSGQTLASVINITERKRTEELLRLSEVKFRDLIESTSDLIWEVDMGGVYKYASPQVESMLGYKPEEVIGMSPFELMPPEEAKKIAAVFKELIEAGKPIVRLENVNLHKDGRRVVLETSGLPFYDDAGKVIGYRGVDRNITERKQVETEKEQLENALQHSQKMESLGHLTGGIAHEFNNLLGIIRGFTGLAVTKCTNQGDEKLLGFMRNIDTASERASNLVAQMLSFSRTEQIDDVPLNISSLILDNFNILRATLPSTIEIKTKVDPQLPRILVNPKQINQILMNLSVNARDAMDGVGKLTIRLCWRYGLDTEDSISHKQIEGDWIELSVSDTGSGIEPEIVKNIFDPFFTTKEVGKGTGMGLSTIYRIVEDHAGHILIDSEQGKGTTFRLLFPPIVNEDTEDTEDSDLTEELSEIPEGDGFEILVVDDEEMLAVHMSELVKEYGYKAHYVTNSVEALDLFKQDPERFSILITDQTMPKMTGKELIEKLRAIRPELPVIMCSGYSDKINSDDAYELNISYFSKPVDVSAVMREISNLLVLRN